MLEAHRALNLPPASFAVGGQKMHEELTELVTSLKQAHGENLVSVILYGSMAVGDHVPDRSHPNVLVVLGRITPADLRLARRSLEVWQRRHPLPLYFTREEMLDARDVFPIEFLDMSAAHRVLYGEDPLVGLEIPTHNLRHQLEFELRGKLIRLRGLYISTSHAADRLLALMTDSIVSFATLFRHVVRLCGIADVEHAKRKVIDQLGRTLGMDVSPFHAVLDAREKKLQLSLADADDLFARYLAAIETVIRSVDALEERP